MKGLWTGSNRGYEQSPLSVLRISVEPPLDPFHGHPRFQKLLAKLGLADPQ